MHLEFMHLAQVCLASSLVFSFWSQIEKNKGITTYKKKELRNPRVKHRMKYRKANIRHKVQVCNYY